MKVALLGYGTVAKGVFEIINNSSTSFFQKNDVTIKKILVRNISKYKDKSLLTSNYNNILEDKEITVIFEAMGGCNPAYEYIKEALRNGKHVITANKEVVSIYLYEFLQLAKENNVYFMFEASVGGTIPIIQTLIEACITNEITDIRGIMNGTSNYILSVINEGLTFHEALMEAQRLGFAEVDPTSDLEGADMIRKIAILADIAFSCFIDINQVKAKGISKLNDFHLNEIKNRGYILKYMAYAKLIDKKIDIAVMPTLLRKEDIFSSVLKEFNMISIDGEISGNLRFYGRGAGMLPTAHAMCQDLVKIMQNSASKIKMFENTYEIGLDMKHKYLIFKGNEVKELKLAYNELDKYNDYELICQISDNGEIKRNEKI